MTLLTESGPYIYELTVIGALGPVLREAMQPLTATACELCTILRAVPRRDGDLVDLLELLDSLGLDVAQISVRD